MFEDCINRPNVFMLFYLQQLSEIYFLS